MKNGLEDQYVIKTTSASVMATQQAPVQPGQPGVQSGCCFRERLFLR